MGGIKKLMNRKGFVNIAILIILVVFPMFNSPYKIDVMAKCVSFVIFAISIDLLWGYTGILSLGQAVFFGLGAYIAAISNNVSKGLPNYMAAYGLTEVPAIFEPLKNPFTGIAFALLLPALFAFLIGKLLISGKVRGVFVSLITMAMANVFQLYANNAQKYTGGSNGISNIQRPNLFGNVLTIEGNYYFLLILAVIVFVVCFFLTNSKFGKALNAIKVNEDRMEFIGYKVSDYKVFIYVFSSVLAALSGILYARTAGMMSPAVTGIEMSTMAVIYVAVGGRGNLTGAVAGCLILSLLERFMASFIGDVWKLIVGLMLLAIVCFLPDGIVGSFLRWKPAFSKSCSAKSKKNGGAAIGDVKEDT